MSKEPLIKDGGPYVYYDHLLKILLLGDAGVGKTSIITRYVDNIWSETTYPTIGVDFYIKTYQLDSKVIKLQIWDTAGEEKYKSITSVYYRGAHAAILVFDLTRPETLEMALEWREQVLKWTPNANFVLVGNKSDLVLSHSVVEQYSNNPELNAINNPDAVLNIKSLEQHIEQVCQKYDMSYLEVSAKADQNISTIFKQVVEKLTEPVPITTKAPKEINLKSEPIEVPTDECCTIL